MCVTSIGREVQAESINRTKNITLDHNIIAYTFSILETFCYVQI